MLGIIFSLNAIFSPGTVELYTSDSSSNSARDPSERATQPDAVVVPNSKSAELLIAPAMTRLTAAP